MLDPLLLGSNLGQQTLAAQPSIPPPISWTPPPREDPAQTRQALAGGFDNRTTSSSALFSRR